MDKKTADISQNPTSAASLLPCALWSGWLTKQSGHTSPRASTILTASSLLPKTRKNWRKRFFILSKGASDGDGDACLYYYKSVGDLMPVGCVFLNSYTDITHDVSSKKSKFCWKLSCRDSETDLTAAAEPLNLDGEVCDLKMISPSVTTLSLDSLSLNASPILSASANDMLECSSVEAIILPKHPKLSVACRDYQSIDASNSLIIQESKLHRIHDANGVGSHRATEGAGSRLRAVKGKAVFYAYADGFESMQRWIDAITPHLGKPPSTSNKMVSGKACLEDLDDGESSLDLSDCESSAVSLHFAPSPKLSIGHAPPHDLPPPPPQLPLCSNTSLGWKTSSLESKLKELEGLMVGLESKSAKELRIVHDSMRMVHAMLLRRYRDQNQTQEEK